MKHYDEMPKIQALIDISHRTVSTKVQSNKVVKQLRSLVALNSLYPVKVKTTKLSNRHDTKCSVRSFYRN